jgi:hypothetical protein
LQLAHKGISHVRALALHVKRGLQQVIRTVGEDGRRFVPRVLELLRSRKGEGNSNSKA